MLPGVYLDGGFGVGKTHLLASLWHVAPGPKYFGTFIEYTALVGALGYANAVKLLSGARLICIDEFELGEGRFAAADFLREIHALAANFETLRIDGLDYRRRDTEGRASTIEGDE